MRSFNASEYIGFDLSANKVLETMDAANPPFDLVIGHSQGGKLWILDMVHFMYSYYV